MCEPTVIELLRQAQHDGLKVRRHSCKVNGEIAFKIEGRVGLFTKDGLMAVLGQEPEVIWSNNGSWPEDSDGWNGY